MLSFGNVADINIYTEFYLTKVEIKDFNTTVGRNNTFDRAVKNVEG